MTRRRRHGARRAAPVPVLVLVMAAVVILAGCSSPTRRASSPPPTTEPVVGVPLASTFGTTTGELAVVAMGRPGDPLNTFWQLFVLRSNGTPHLTLATPPGVADNGGLVVNSSPLPGPTVLAGFEPSQALVFSPLALSQDGGGSWLPSPGLVPGGLAAVPDVLAGSSGAEVLALSRARGGEILRSPGDLAHWSKLVDRSALGSSPTGRACGVGGLTAVALDASGHPLVGTSCTSPGVVGIFVPAADSWRRVGPRLPGRTGSAPTTVLRLVHADGMTSGLVAAATTPAPVLVGVASTRGRVWSHSAPLPLDRGTHIVSTGVESGGGFVVLAAGHGSMALHAETGPAGDWTSLPSPPAGTATVAVGTGGEVDALAVASTALTEWRLDTAAGSWSKIGSVKVPIQFGSSA